MSQRRQTLAAILIWSGVALLLLGLVLFFPRILPLVETLAYTQRIPTAPPLVVTETQSSEPLALLPFESDVETEVLAEATATATPAPTDTPVASDVEEDVTPTPTAPPTPTPTPVWPGTAPTHLLIPSIALDAPVVSIGLKSVVIGGETQAMWDVPDWRAAGWHSTSANIGVSGNTVLNGHNTSRGEVFRDLYKVEPGAEVFVEGTDGETYTYRVEEKYILREAGQPLSVRQENARYIMATPDERLTFVTCHPYGSLANRLVVIAYPVDDVQGLPEGAN